MKLSIVRFNKKKRDLLVFGGLALTLKLLVLSLVECQNLCISCVYCLVGDLFAECICGKESKICAAKDYKALTLNLILCIL